MQQPHRGALHREQIGGLRDEHLEMRAFQVAIELAAWTEPCLDGIVQPVSRYLRARRTPMSVRQY